MPGLAVNDFGDSIRFGASTGAEDEPDLSRIWCDLELYELYVKGFIEGCGGALTDIELDLSLIHISFCLWSGGNRNGRGPG